MRLALVIVPYSAIGFTPKFFSSKHYLSQWSVPSTPCSPIRRTLSEVSTSGSTLDEAATEKGSENEKFQGLYSLVCPDSPNSIRLEESESGVRGAYLDNPVIQDDIILSIPLSMCLTDENVPQWMNSLDDIVTAGSYSNPSVWATRLASVLIDNLLNESPPEHIKQWLSLLPQPSYLRASLPTHWEDNVLVSARCTALELLNDSTFFARATAVQDLLQCLGANTAATHLDETFLKEICENALDLVQTRTCRPHADEDWGPPPRVLAPVFDFLNHQEPGQANARFGLEGDSVVVRAKYDISEDQEVFIDYGESTRPAWKCLSSYGFVPEFKPETLGDEAEAESHVAEVYIEGTRYEVGPGSIPEDMVAAVAATVDPAFDPSEPVTLTAELAIHIARRVSDVAFQLLLDLDPSPPSTSITSTPENGDRDETPTFDDDGDDHDDVPPEQIISSHLAAELRWNQHRILLACSMGLRDFAAAQIDR